MCNHDIKKLCVAYLHLSVSIFTLVTNQQNIDFSDQTVLEQARITISCYGKVSHLPVPML